MCLQYKILISCIPFNCMALENNPQFVIGCWESIVFKVCREEKITIKQKCCPAMLLWILSGNYTCLPKLKASRKFSWHHTLCTKSKHLKDLHLREHWKGGAGGTDLHWFSPCFKEPMQKKLEVTSLEEKKIGRHSSTMPYI